MISDKTLLILGAGASRPYLFPTARELTNLILEDGENAELLVNMGFMANQFIHEGTMYPFSAENTPRQYRFWFEDEMKAVEVEKHELEQFQERFRLSQSYSIDAFVADNPFYQPLASLMIAAILLRCEQLKQLTGDWYQLLFHELIEEHGKDFPVNSLLVVTFNYDRSLEMFLFQAFKHRYNLTNAKAWELVKRIGIVHVYGSLGSLFDANGNRNFGYGARGVRPAAENLRLVGQRTDEIEDQRIATFTEHASRVVFLGFGFDRLNLQPIKMQTGSKKVFASCFGLSSMAMVRAEANLREQDPANTRATLINWGDRAHDAAAFLHNSLALA